MSCQALDGITPVSPLGNFFTAAIHLRIAEVMPMEAVRLAFEERWPLAPPGTGDSFPRRFVHCQGIHAVDLHPRNAIRRRHVGDIGDQGDVVLRGPLRVLVILTDVYHGQLPDRRDVNVLMEWPTVGSPVTKKAHGYLARLA